MWTVVVAMTYSGPLRVRASQEEHPYEYRSAENRH